jgi:hypothetical protein
MGYDHKRSVTKTQWDIRQFRGTEFARHKFANVFVKIWVLREVPTIRFDRVFNVIECWSARPRDWHTMSFVGSLEIFHYS